MSIAAVIASARYGDCFECRGRCCKFFGVPVQFENDLKTIGVPLVMYKSALEPDPAKYFGLHKGVTIKDDKFIVAKDIRVERKTTKRFGPYLIVHSICGKLTKDGKCSIHSERPSMCKNFTKETATQYEVPWGCMYDTDGSLGEDFGV